MQNRSAAVAVAVCPATVLSTPALPSRSDCCSLARNGVERKKHRVCRLSNCNISFNQKDIDVQVFISRLQVDFLDAVTGRKNN
jgi:hypothetical protein